MTDIFLCQRKHLIGSLFLIAMLWNVSAAHAATLPDPNFNPPNSSQAQTIALAGGCFWGMQAVYQHVKGVKEAISGYAGGTAETANYKTVSSGSTTHAESVKIIYDPSQVSLGEILKVFFSVAHDPTELNRQGPDRGTQYRSAIFTTTAEQEKVAETYIAQLQQAKVYSVPIVTKVEMLKGFYPAEDYHQNYARLHPYNAYIMINDAPKVSALKEEFPQLYIDP